MTSKIIRPVFLIIVCLGMVVGCANDDTGPTLDLLPGNGQPCEHYQIPEFQLGPKDINPPYADVQFAFNPMNPEEAICIHRNWDVEDDSVFRYNFVSSTKTFVTTSDYPWGFAWSSKDWILINVPYQLQKIKSNGDSLTELPVHRNLPTIGWSPSGTRFFGSEFYHNTWIYNENGQLLDSIMGFYACEWLSEDTLIGVTSSGESSEVQLYDLATRSLRFQIPLPRLPLQGRPLEALNWIMHIKLHPDREHVSIVTPNAVWIASLKTGETRQIMFCCYGRVITDIFVHPQRKTLLVEQNTNHQIGPDVSERSYYLIELNAFSGLRLDTLVASPPF